MFILDSVACADSFPTDGQQGGAQIIASGGTNGGYAAVSGADVYMQIAYGRSGMVEWTPPVHIAPGNIILAPGTLGVRFRNYVAGVVATISAGLSELSEPPIQPTAAGVATTPSSSGAVQLVQTIGPLAIAQANLDFTAIPTAFGTLTGRHLRLELQARGTNASTTVLLTMLFNGDVGANYDGVESFNRTAGAGLRLMGPAGASFNAVSDINAATDAAGSASPVTIDIPNYSLGTLRKQFRAKGFAKNNADADGTNFLLLESGGEWRSTAILSRVTLGLSAGNFDVGTLASLYALTG